MMHRIYQFKCFHSKIILLVLILIAVGVFNRNALFSGTVVKGAKKASVDLFCPSSVVPSQANFGPSGGQGGFAVLCPSDGTSCFWGVSQFPPWITIQNGIGSCPGVGGGVTYTVQPNTGGPRSGTIIINTRVGPLGQSVSQAGVAFSATNR
jgi:hypothetical protein